MAVTFGIPVLLFAIDTIQSTTQLEIAHTFAERVHNATAMVDTGMSEDLEFQITVPLGVTVTANSHTLTITYTRSTTSSETWSREYIHSIDLIAPEGPGGYTLRVRLIEDSIELVFNSIS